MGRSIPKEKYTGESDLDGVHATAAWRREDGAPSRVTSRRGNTARSLAAAAAAAGEGGEGLRR